MIDREKVIKKLESLRDICNAKSNMAIGNGKIAWAGYANAADDALALLKDQPQWISVKDRLPDDASDVLAYYNNGTESRVIPVNYYKGCWYDCVFNRSIDNLETGFIGYWMSLPEPPEGVNPE